MATAERVSQALPEETSLTRPTRRPSSAPSRPQNNDRLFKENYDHRKNRDMCVVTFATMKTHQGNKEVYVFITLCGFSFGAITLS